jgi:hypothetical protein
LKSSNFKLQTANFKLWHHGSEARVAASPVVPSPDPVPFAIEEEAEDSRPEEEEQKEDALHKEKRDARSGASTAQRRHATSVNTATQSDTANCRSSTSTAVVVVEL